MNSLLSQLFLGCFYSQSGGNIPMSPPTISGVLRVSGTYTGEPGLWQGSPNLSYRWQTGITSTGVWENISGETGLTYLITSGAIHHSLRIVETDSVSALENPSSGSALVPSSDVELLIFNYWDGNETVNLVDGETYNVPYTTTLVNITGVSEFGYREINSSALPDPFFFELINGSNILNVYVLAEDGVNSKNHIVNIYQATPPPSWFGLRYLTVNDIEGSSPTYGDKLSFVGTANGASTYSYIFYRNGEEVQNSSSPDYYIVGLDIGTIISCDAYAAGPGGNTIDPDGPYQTWIIESVPIADTAPVATPDTGPPAPEGAIITVTEGTWYAHPSITSFIYSNDGSNGGTTNEVTVAGADSGNSITFTVTAENSVGSTPQNSNSVECA